MYGALMTHPVALRSGRGAMVEGFAVRFLTRGVPMLEPSFATLVESPEETAHGVLVPFDERTWRRERLAEATYATRTVRATTLTGEVYDAIALVHGFATRERETAPSARYASLLVAGARHHGLPDHVVDRYVRLHTQGASLTLRIARLLRTDGEARVARHLGRR